MPFQYKTFSNKRDELKIMLDRKGVILGEYKSVFDKFPLYVKENMRNSWNQALLSKKYSLLDRYIKCER